jgi:methyl-accepting chemotaxis protein
MLPKIPILSLNASIEAAHAGEIGSIVLNVIQKLDSYAQDSAILSDELGQTSKDWSKSAESWKKIGFFQTVSTNES